MLFDSLHQKLMTLPDSTLVYPAHGAGSLCGRQMSADAVSTIGRERTSNYALQARTREQFVDLLTSELPPRPAYFAGEVERNREGATPLAELGPLPQLSPDQVESLAADSSIVVLDTRPAIQFAAAHVPRSVHVGLGGQFASWAARLVGLSARLVLVGEDEEAVYQARTRLARVGIENVAGSLACGIPGWVSAGKPVHYVPEISVQDLAERRAQHSSETHVLDVREAGERASGFLQGSLNIPLGQLLARIGEIGRDGMWFVHCKGGYRSSSAVSLLMRQGYENAANVIGGFDAWQVAFPGGA
jgi:hydroxyacylglutathione hydrolase